MFNELVMSGSGLGLKIEQAATHNIIEDRNNITPFFFIGFLSNGLNRSDGYFQSSPTCRQFKRPQITGFASGAKIL
jgi:hypothetical protein